MKPRFLFALLIAMIPGVAAAQTELVVAFDEAGSVQDSTPLSFVPFSVYFVAFSAPAIESWSASFETSDPRFVILSVTPWNATHELPAEYGDFMVALAGCQTPAATQVLLRADLIWVSGPIPDEEITLCPFDPSASTPTLPAYTACSAEQSTPFENQGMDSCAAVNGDCAPAVQNTMALAVISHEHSPGRGPVFSRGFPTLSRGFPAGIPHPLTLFS
jgi:hypothetical protein